MEKQIKDVLTFSEKTPLQVGLVGTGYAAKKRAEAIQTDDRARLVAVTGNTPERTAAFSQNYGVSSIDSWLQLVNSPDLDLVIICTINREHGAIARAALEADKHVIVEYPLALNPAEAESLIALAKTKNKLLHVEHIELLGGLHQAIRQNLPEIGDVFYARYITVSPQHPAPRRWTYNYSLYGFPLTAALSRLHRFTDLFGNVASVSCRSRFWDAPEQGYYTACLCNAQLRFNNGLIGEVTYGKGETFWQGYRTFELHGERGTMIFEGEKGTLIRGEEKRAIEVGTRRGLFAKDTAMVFDRLLLNKPLYVSPESSCYALAVAEAARKSAEMGQNEQVISNK
jgi:biliverdin reductase